MPAGQVGEGGQRAPLPWPIGRGGRASLGVGLFKVQTESGGESFSMARIICQC